MAENAPQRDIDQTRRIVCLCAHVKNGDHATDENEEQRAIETRADPQIHRESNVIYCCTTRIEEEDYHAAKRADDRGNDDGPPVQTDGDQAGTQIVGGRREGNGELKGKKVPG